MCSKSNNPTSINRKRVLLHLGNDKIESEDLVIWGNQGVSFKGYCVPLSPWWNSSV